MAAVGMVASGGRRWCFTGTEQSVAIALADEPLNQDVGDSWEDTDNPDYPVPTTSLGYRFGINYIVYAMTR